MAPATSDVHAGREDTRIAWAQAVVGEKGQEMGDAASAVGMPSAASLAVATQLVQSEFMMRQKSFKGAKFKNISEGIELTGWTLVTRR
jgi:hypothetical protein